MPPSIPPLEFSGLAGAGGIGGGSAASARAREANAKARAARQASNGSGDEDTSHAAVRKAAEEAAIAAIAAQQKRKQPPPLPSAVALPDDTLKSAAVVDKENGEVQLTTPRETPRGTTAAKEKTKKSSMISGLMGRSKRNKEKEGTLIAPSGVPTSGGVDIRSVLQNDEVLSPGTGRSHAALTTGGRSGMDTNRSSAASTPTMNRELRAVGGTVVKKTGATKTSPPKAGGKAASPPKGGKVKAKKSKLFRL